MTKNRSRHHKTSERPLLCPFSEEVSFGPLFLIRRGETLRIVRWSLLRLLRTFRQARLSLLLPCRPASQIRRCL